VLAVRDLGAREHRVGVLRARDAPACADGPGPETAVVLSEVVPHELR
jgi:hypothetical protein